ncbi:phage virion morphogenesis protein [Puniceibacterium sp. IMCC21224]|uniref:phage virion morphogenesis protein n=1 Tax=Puniceibacterium sp. IMCC21224 TaxID=1618204 RepID=UPI00064DA171|nr:phage virion morphogenesis protein [Puniceibacterium sp. IMCC21224]KMK68571.1 phage virion morphogenesis protein, putative tail completion [Puniceibacterium sp. IMCC21224]
MTGISVTVEIDDAELRAKLQDMIGRMDRPVGFFKNVGEHLLNSTRDNFESESSPDGVPWAQLKPATVRARQKRKQTPIKILQATKNTGLMASINHRTMEVGDGQVSIGSPKVYAAIHQLGGTIKKAARQATIYQNYDKRTDTFDPTFRRKSKSNFASEVTIPAHEITIPARPYLGVSAEDQEIIIEIADAWLNEP